MSLNNMLFTMLFFLKDVLYNNISSIARDSFLKHWRSFEKHSVLFVLAWFLVIKTYYSKRYFSYITTYTRSFEGLLQSRFLLVSGFATASSLIEFGAFNTQNFIRPFITNVWNVPKFNLDLPLLIKTHGTSEIGLVVLKNI